MLKEDVYKLVIAELDSEMEDQERICEEYDKKIKALQEVYEEHKKKLDFIAGARSTTHRIAQKKLFVQREVQEQNGKQKQDFDGVFAPEAICKLFAENPARLYNAQEIASELSARGVEGTGRDGRIGISVGTAKTTLYNLYYESKIRREGRGQYGALKSRQT